MGWLDFIRSLFCKREDNYLKIVELSNLSDGVLINFVKLSNVFRTYGIDDLIIADKFYYVFPLKKWKKALTKVYKELSRHESYTLESWDCDNYSSFFSSFFKFCFYQTFKEKHNACIGIAWSDTHAYNVFVDDKLKAYVYEPQNNSIFELDKVPSDTYNTKRVMYIS